MVLLDVVNTNSSLELETVVHDADFILYNDLMV